MVDHVALHSMAQRLRDAVGPADLGDAIQDVDESLQYGEEGLAIELSLEMAVRPLPADLLDELYEWSKLLSDRRKADVLPLLERVPRAA